MNQAFLGLNGKEWEKLPKNMTRQVMVLMTMLMVGGVMGARHHHPSGEGDDENTTTVCFREPSSPSLSSFTEELPILPRIDVSTGVPLVIGAYRIKQRFHTNLPSTTLYAFGTSVSTAYSPGPILEVKLNTLSFVYDAH